MNTLVIYDNNGTIFFQASGNIQAPVGLPFMWVEVPHGQRLERIDTTQETHAPVFVDIPKTPIELEMDQLKADNEMLKNLVAELGLMVGGGL